MTAQSIVCGACSAEVPYGRLSCPSCGDLLASVTRGRRRSSSPSGRAASTVSGEPGPAVAPTPSARPAIVVAPASTIDVDAGLPWTNEPATETESADPASADVDVPVPAATAKGGDVAPTTDSLWDIANSETDDDPTPEPLAAAVPAPRSPLGAPAFAGPGAYVPPPPVRASAPSLAPARAWAGRAEMSGLMSGADVASRAGSEQHAAALPDGPARLAEFTGWLSVAGAALAAVGFLLPWGVVMIGSTGAGYFDRWGLAGPAHVVVAGGLLAVIALAFIKNDIAPWIRVGLPGLGFGALLLGLVWPYLLGPLGSGPGALIVVVGSIALTVSGILALAGDRHAGTDRPV